MKAVEYVNLASSSLHLDHHSLAYLLALPQPVHYIHLHISMTTYLFATSVILMAESTRSKLFIPDPVPSEHQLFQQAKKKLQNGGHLLLRDVPKDLALPLIEGLDSDPQIGSEGKYRYATT